MTRLKCHRPLPQRARGLDNKIKCDVDFKVKKTVFHFQKEETGN